MSLQQTHTKQEREYLHTLIAGAVLPFIQATTFAAVIFVAVWVIAAVVFNAMDPHKPAAFIAAIAWAWFLNRLFRHWLSLTTPTQIIERVIQKDINGDGVIGPKPQAPAKEEPRVVRVQLTQVKETGHVQTDTFDLPGNEFQLSTLAKGLLYGAAPFTERYWVRAQKVFSRDEWDALRDAMRNRDEPLAEYVDPENKQQGMRLTEAGKATLQKLSNLPHSPTSEGEA